jgi:hypothetical protein
MVPLDWGRRHPKRYRVAGDDERFDGHKHDRSDSDCYLPGD